MSYTKGRWKPYGNSIGGYSIEIEVKDITGVRLDHFRVCTEKAYQQVLRIIHKKYGFKL